MSLPSNVNYGLVSGRYILAVGDTSDPDNLPDMVPATGTVTFTPSAPILLDPSTTPPTTIAPQPIECTFNVDGDLIDPDGSVGVYLIATDDADINPVGWTWRVSIAFDGIAKPLTFDIQVPSDGAVDLTTLTPVPNANGVFYLVGPQGVQGAQGVKGDTGDQGIQGAQGIQGIKGDQGIQGILGPVGLKGDKGDKGDTGDVGPQGVQGVQGAIGPVGVDLKGDWSSTVDYQRLDGVSYNGASWYASIDPPTGAVPSDASPYWHYLSQRGLQGVQGVQGTQGPKGEKGDPGEGSVNSVNGNFGPDIVLDATDVGARPSDWVPTFDEVASKPSTFPPSAHGHAATDLTSGTIADARLPLRLAYNISTNQVTNLDTLDVTGWAWCTASVTTGVPEAFGDWRVFTERYSGTYAAQWAFLPNLKKSWFRLKINNVWGAWERTYQTETELDARYVPRAGSLITDYNNAVTSGWYLDYGGATPNTPTSSGSKQVLVQAYNTTYVRQTAYIVAAGGANDTSTYQRECVNGTWTAWYRLRSSEAELDARYALPSRLGPYTNAVSITDLNTATAFGFYSALAGATNSPPNGGTKAIFVQAYAPNYVRQTAYRVDGDNSTYQRELVNGVWGAWYALSLAAPKILSVTTSYTPLLPAAGDFTQLNSPSAIVVTLPSDSAVAFPVGTVLTFQQINTGLCSFAAGSGATVTSTPGLKLVDRYSVAEARKVAANSWTVYGRLMA